MYKRFIFGTLYTYTFTTGYYGYLKGKRLLNEIEDTNTVIKYRMENYKIKYQLNNEQMIYLKDILYKNPKQDDILSIIKYGSVFYYIYGGPILLYKFIKS